MASDRRSFLCVAAWALATVGCSWPNRAPSAVSSDGWFAFKARFFSDDGRIIDSGNGGISHSEGQGYGMLLAALANDREAFDAMHGWAEASLLRDDTALFSWRYDPTEEHPVSDPNNASDGDILIAWALLIAGKRWEEKAYLSRSQEIREAMADPLSTIVDAVRTTLERCPPELAADLVDRGIVLAGGGALLKGLDRLLREETGLPVHVAEDPLSAVAEGTGKALQELSLLKRVTNSDR